MLGSLELELPNTYSGQKENMTGCLLVKIKCFEEEHVIKAADVLGVSQQTEPAGLLWEM